jgi:predicted oxidoreductase
MKKNISSAEQLEKKLKQALLIIKTLYISFYDSETLNPGDLEDMENLLIDPTCKNLIKNEKFYAWGGKERIIMVEKYLEALAEEHHK